MKFPHFKVICIIIYDGYTALRDMYLSCDSVGAAFCEIGHFLPKKITFYMTHLCLEFLSVSVIGG